MRKLLLLAMPLALIALIAVQGAMAAEKGKRPTRTVEIGDDFFDASKIRVKQGTKVIFKWTGTSRHNAHGTSGQKFTTGKRGRTGGEKGVIIDAEPGTKIRYICDFHPFDMVGRITVTR